MFRLNMAEICNDPDTFTKRLETLEAWVEEHPQDNASHFVLGYVYYFLQDYERSKHELAFTLSAEPVHPQALRLPDAIYEREADPERVEA